jgi:hypothetical protein
MMERLPLARKFLTSWLWLFVVFLCSTQPSCVTYKSKKPNRQEVNMRFLLKVNIPVESGNAAAKAGKLGATIQSILADLKPEAVYFTDNDGQRAGFIFLEIQDASQIPAIAEPWFLAFNASIEIHPVMVPDDLARAGGAIEKAVKKYA